MISEKSDDVERFIVLMDKFNDDIEEHIRDTIEFLTNGITEIYRYKDANQITIMLQLFVSNYCVSLLGTSNNAIINALEEFGLVLDLKDEVEHRKGLK